MYGVINYQARKELEINTDQYLLLYHIYISSKQGYCSKPALRIAEEMFLTKKRVEKLLSQLKAKALIFSNGSKSNIVRTVTLKVQEIFKKYKYKTTPKTGVVDENTTPKTGVHYPQNGGTTTPKTGVHYPQNRGTTTPKTGVFNIVENKEKEEYNKGGCSVEDLPTNDQPPWNIMKEKLEKLISSDLGKTTLEADLQQQRINPPSTKELVNQIGRWSKKMYEKRPEMVRWKSWQLLAHFTGQWMPRTKNDEKFKNNLEKEGNDTSNFRKGHQISQERIDETQRILAEASSRFTI